MKNEKEVMDVVICPPCGESTATSGVRGGYKATSLMSPSIGPADHFLRKGGRNGFTLIELLVVVLIIGILAAVAVPQYQVAVKKAQLARLIPLVKTLKTAEEAYYLANGTYTVDLMSLDIQVPTNNCTYSPEGYYFNCGEKKETWGIWGDTIQAGDSDIRYLQFLDHTEGARGQIVCYSRGDIARKVCKTLGPGEEKSGELWTYHYWLK